MKDNSYDIADFGAMAADAVRLDAYRRALAEVVTPGCTVLDLGAGTGLLGFLAFQLGAGHVVCVEPGPAAEYILAVAARNGAADRFSVHRAMSTDVSLDAPVDVIVSDLRGTLPLFGRHVETIVDARRRLLRPGGRLIPLRDEILADLVVAAWPFDRQVRIWDECAPGWDQSIYRDLAVRTSHRSHFRAKDVAGVPATVGRIDYEAVRSPHLTADLQWPISEARTIYGVALWFRSHLTEQVSYDSGPTGATVYGQLFLPLVEPAALIAGDQLAVRLLLFFDGQHHLHRWRATLVRGGQATVLDGFPAPPADGK